MDQLKNDVWHFTQKDESMQQVH